MWLLFLLASNSKSETLFKVTADTDTKVQTLSHLVKMFTAIVKPEDSLLDSQNTISASYTESDVNKFVENYFNIFAKIDISLTQ
jgi:hypothetical protein